MSWGYPDKGPDFGADKGFSPHELVGVGYPYSDFMNTVRHDFSNLCVGYPATGEIDTTTQIFFHLVLGYPSSLKVSP